VVLGRGPGQRADITWHRGGSPGRRGDYAAVVAGAVASLLASFALAWVLLRTEFGWQVRATAEDPVMATLSGIAVPRTRLLVFAGGVALLAIPAGALMTFYYVTPFVGIHFSILSLLIVTLGGLGDLRGAFFGGLIIGLVESMSSALIAGPAAGSAIYVVFGILLVFRPRGLFGVESWLEQTACLARSNSASRSSWSGCWASSRPPCSIVTGGDRDLHAAVDLSVRVVERSRRRAGPGVVRATRCFSASAPTRRPIWRRCTA